jgi:hypothetical protein
LTSKWKVPPSAEILAEFAGKAEGWFLVYLETLCSQAFLLAVQKRLKEKVQTSKKSENEAARRRPTCACTCAAGKESPVPSKQDNQKSSITKV